MGARLVRDLNPAGSSSPESIISIDGWLYFTAVVGDAAPTPTPDDDAASDSDSDSDTDSDTEATTDASSTTEDPVQALGQGLALLKSDGTEAGTKVVKEFNAINDLVEVDGELYFIADDGTGNRLWRSDGTTRGTVLVKDLYPGADPNFPQDLYEVDGVLFYSAIDKDRDGISGVAEGGIGKYPYVNGYEVWRREGNGVGSRFFRNLIPDKFISGTTTTKEEEEVLALDSNGDPIPLLKEITTTVTIDGETTTTTTTTTEQIYIQGAIATNRSTETERAETTDGDIEGTTTDTETSFAMTTQSVYTAEIETSVFENDSFPQNFVEINGNYFFTAQSSSAYTLDTFTDSTLIGGLELWFSDGTEAGTRPININQNEYTFYEPEDGAYTPASIISDPSFGFKRRSSSSFPRELTPFNDQLLLVANDGNSGFELWAISSEGGNLRQISNLSEGNTSSSPQELTVVGDNLYFTADDGSGRKLWSINSDLQALTEIDGAGLEPKDLSSIDGKLFFSAKSDLGRELWSITNGAASLVHDINPGSGSSSPKHFTQIDQINNRSTKSQLFFTANDGKRGSELWTLDLDKANAKPRRYVDIVEGPSSSDPRQLINAEQKLYFTADDGTNGRELWTLGVDIETPSNGIELDSGSEKLIKIEHNEGTKRVTTLSSDAEAQWGLNGGQDSDLFKINANGSLKFIDAPNYEQPSDRDHDNSYEVRVRATDPSVGSSTDQLLQINVIEVSSGGDNGSNGDNGNGDNGNGGGDGETSNPPQIKSTLVKNIRSGASGSAPSDLSALDKTLIFAADNGKKGVELWISDGSGAGTSLLKDIHQGPESSEPSGFTPFQSKLFFAADDGNSGLELWSTDGTSNGTRLEADLRPGERSSTPTDLVNLDNSLLFGADDGIHGSELWGIQAGTNSAALIKDINPTSASTPTGFTNYKRKSYFAAEGPVYGRELWVTDGTTKGTKLAVDINPGGMNSNPEDLIVFEGDLYFTAETYSSGGKQVWSTDGTTSGLRSITPETGENSFKDARHLAATEDHLFFSAKTTLSPSDNNGSPSGGDGSTPASDPGGYMVAAQGLGPSAINDINTYNDYIDSYREDKPDTFYLTLAKSRAESFLQFEKDSSLANDWNQYFHPLVNVSPIQVPEGISSDAASRSIDPSPGDENIFQEDDANTLGRALWISNGRDNGTILLKDIKPGPEGSNPQALTTINDQLYFSADDGIHGDELWVSDGTADGTYMISDINRGSKSSSPRSIIEAGGVIYFSAKEKSVGRELWRLGQDQTAVRIVSTGKGAQKHKAIEQSHDEFVFDVAGQFGKKKADRITGFTPSDGDQLALAQDVFPGLSAIELVTVSSKRQLKSQRSQASNLIYFEPKGRLFFDQNGSDPGYGDDGGLFAILKGGPDLAESAFRIV